MSKESAKVLDTYVKHGLVRMHEWQILPNGIDERMRIHGQLVSYHDCLMINRNVSMIDWLTVQRSAPSVFLNQTIYLFAIPERTLFIRQPSASQLVSQIGN